MPGTKITKRLLESSRRLLLPALATLSVFSLSSCVIPANTHRDQLASLAKYDTQGINSTVNLPELKDAPIGKFSAADFLTLHSGMLVSGEYVSSQKFKDELETFRGDQQGELTLGFSVPIANGGTGFGSCAPITSDGYFLTVAHVLSHEDTFVLYATSNGKRTFIDTAKCRTVFRDDGSDFAIIKAEIKTPRILKFRKSPLTSNSTLFAGGWMHEKAGGKFREIVPITGFNGQRTPYYKVITSIPMIKGDSGSPLIDQNGELCGVLSTMRLGVVVKMKPLSTAVMMDHGEIFKIIENDRKRYSR
ncbi:MAG: serine protease [Verrucomicrobiales bacterium]|nr:serine protease [Verrucomicrobiales bacterium]